MEKNNDRKLPLKSLQPKITARSSKLVQKSRTEC